VHLDLVPLDRRRDEEVDRLLDLGARVVDDQRRPDGAGWVVLADPEGNEFCVERTAWLDEQLGRAFAAVGDLITNVRLEQWSAPTPYRSPLGEATGAERLQIRLYDLLAHGWDLAQATGQPAALPDDVAEQSLAFVRTQLTEHARPGRFGPAERVAEDARAIERLVAFLGRPVNADR
jgi:hypothetical protein